MKFSRNTKNTNIERMSDNDINRILEIQDECNLSRWTREGYKGEISKKDSIMFVAHKAEDVIGFIVGRKIISDSESITKFAEAEILNFGVAKKFQKMGIGSHLFEKFLNESGEFGIETIWLEVRAGNSEALHFYQNRGFVKIQTRKSFYTNPVEDAFLLKCSL